MNLQKFERVVEQYHRNERVKASRRRNEIKIHGTVSSNVRDVKTFVYRNENRGAVRVG